MGTEETARLLNTAAARLARADWHEAQAAQLADADDADSIARAAHHFTVAAGLRGRARFVQ